MLIEISVAGAVGTVIAMQLGRRNEERQDWRRREQLLIQGLRQRGVDEPGVTKPHLSQRRLEMECLLHQLTAAADTLAAALAAEARSGKNPGTPDAESETLYQQWQAARSAVAVAEHTYHEAVSEYREFVQALPVPLRAKAAERGMAAMKLSAACAA